MLRIALLISLLWPIAASSTPSFTSDRIEDPVDVLVEEEQAQLETALQAASDQTGVDLLFLFVEDHSEIHGEDIAFDVYADRMLDGWIAGNPDRPAMLMAFDMTANLARFVTTGDISGERRKETRERLRLAMVPHISNVRWADAVSVAIAEFTALETAATAQSPDGAPNAITPFAQDVSRHVMLHELAHALIREFDLPVLANEEAMADTFATLWLAALELDDAERVVTARVRSWMIEDAEVDPADYDFKGEHLLDIRRAYQAACLLYGADPSRWEQAVAWLAFEQGDLDDCSDTAPDQIDGWTDVLKPHLLPDGETSRRVEVIHGEGIFKEDMIATGLMDELAEVAARFDWPETITLHFDACDRGARWDRRSRTILLCDSYVARFINQGRSLE